MNLNLVYNIKYQFPLKLLHLSLGSFQRLGCLSPSAVPLDLPTLNEVLKVLESFFPGGRQHSWTFGHRAALKSRWGCVSMAGNLSPMLLNPKFRQQKQTKGLRFLLFLHICFCTRILCFFPTAAFPLYIWLFICAASVVIWEICRCTAVNCSQGCGTAKYLVISYSQETDQKCQYSFPYLLSQRIPHPVRILFFLHASPVTLLWSESQAVIFVFNEFFATETYITILLPTWASIGLRLFSYLHCFCKELN